MEIMLIQGRNRCTAFCENLSPQCTGDLRGVSLPPATISHRTLTASNRQISPNNADVSPSPAPPRRALVSQGKSKVLSGAWGAAALPPQLRKATR